MRMVLVTDPQSVLNSWKNFFNKVLNVHEIHNVRQKDIQTAEPLVPEHSHKSGNCYWKVEKQ
jgi:hypothetical protein